MATFNVTFSWDLPATRVDGSALAPSEIASVEITFGVPGEPARSLGVFPPATTTFELQGVDPGDYIASKFTTDTQVPPRTSAGIAVPVHIPVPVLAAPGDGTLTVTFA